MPFKHRNLEQMITDSGANELSRANPPVGVIPRRFTFVYGLWPGYSATLVHLR